MIEDTINQLLLHSPALIVAIPLLGAFLTPLVGKIGPRVRNGFVVFIALLTSFFVFLLANDIITNQSIRTYSFGAANPDTVVVRILFEVDAMNALMIIIGAILVIVSVIYSLKYIQDNTGLDKFYTLVLLMSAGMFGMMMTGDMFNFFVFLEITSIAASALIAFWTSKGQSVYAGLKYMVISTIGALFILFAIALLYSQYNALNMAVLANAIQYSFLDKIALVLLVSGLAMKAGVVPMHMWMPDAYGRAPSSISILLVGATLASIYALFRVIFTIFGNALAYPMNNIPEVNLALMLGILLVALAVITIIVGVMMALKQSDFKRLIAFAAVAEIGYMLLAAGAAVSTLSVNQGVMSLTVSGETALKGGIFHILNDALDVSLLFLVAGSIYYATKETSLNKMGGLARNMKYTTIFFLIGLFAVAGMPPLNGFASKLMIYQSTYQVNPILAIVAILCSILLLAMFVKVFHSAFLGPKIPKFDGVKEVPKTMLIAMGIIACIIIFIGLFPDLVMNNIVEPAANALYNHGLYIGGI